VAWDANRPVPWKRIIKPFAIYAVLANVVFFFLLRGDYNAGVALGTIGGGVLYAAIAYFAVKMGWSPPAFRSKEELAAIREARMAQRAEKQAASGRRGGASSTRSGSSRRPAPARPAPTKRTNASNRRPPKRR
jgi:hypothetical protein